jgi:hypothetical protein
MSAEAMFRELQAGLDEATDVILSQVEAAMARLPGAREGQAGALEDIERRLNAIVEACAFHDLASQRLQIIAAEVALGAMPDAGVRDPLLNGPAARGEGLGQQAADALFAGEDLPSWSAQPHD